LPRFHRAGPFTSLDKSVANTTIQLAAILPHIAPIVKDAQSAIGRSRIQRLFRELSRELPDGISSRTAHWGMYYRDNNSGANLARSFLRRSTARSPALASSITSNSRVSPTSRKKSVNPKGLI